MGGGLGGGKEKRKTSHPFLTEKENYFRLQFRHMPEWAAER